MAEKLEPKEIVALEDLAISNMWEIAALVKRTIEKLCTTAWSVSPTKCLALH